MEYTLPSCPQLMAFPGKMTNPPPMWNDVTGKASCKGHHAKWNAWQEYYENSTINGYASIYFILGGLMFVSILPINLQKWGLGVKIITVSGMCVPVKEEARKQLRSRQGTGCWKYIG